MARRNMREHQAQCRLIEWAGYSQGKYPLLRKLYAIPNAGAGLRKDLQLEGVKAGVPDLHFPCARGKYHSLYIEMKDGKNTLSDKQKEWKADLAAEGNRVAVCYSAEEAQAELISYLNLGEYHG